ncbi:GNAT family N-acetyltransferase [Microlunatus phosphovorus]|nr:GNAT family N-acetyltransferase [Microlunatus phosphovorus]
MPEPTVTAARMFPDCVPTLIDPAAGVTLRAPAETDIDAIVEQCRDPEMIRWTTVPTPEGGYSDADARAFLALVRQGWEESGGYGWAIELAGVPFAGSIDLRPEEAGVAEVGFGLHPAARGRRAMTAALRLVRDYGFDVLGLRVIRWRAAVGNWASRRTATAAGFRFDGTVRLLLNHRGELLDGWLATITADDSREDLSWPHSPELVGTRVRLRPFGDRDLDRIVEACSDATTCRWLVALSTSYSSADAAAYVESTREQAATRSGWTWCIADDTDRCLGSLGLEGFGGYARRLEIGYWAHPDARGHGFVAEAVRLVTEHVEQQRLADSVIIRCAAENTASRRVAEAAGYLQCGVQEACEPLGDGTLDDLVSYSHTMQR